MMKTKCKKDIQKPEKQEKQENKETTEEAEESEIQLPTGQSLQQLQQQLPAQTNNNNKRKSVDDGLPPDRTRPRYSGLTVMSN